MFDFKKKPNMQMRGLEFLGNLGEFLAEQERLLSENYKSDRARHFTEWKQVFCEHT